MEEITFDVDEVTKEPKQRKKKPKQEYVEKKPRSFSVDMVPMADIKPSLANERLHPAENIKYLANGLSEFDMQKPIVIDSDNVIIAGHGIYTALLNQGYTHINVVRSDLKGNKKKAFRVFDNKSGELSKWDDEKLSKTLYELHSDGYAIADYGFEKLDYDFEPDISDKNDDMPDSKLIITVTFKDEDAMETLFQELTKRGFKVKI